jgi:hypothetical protein
MMPNVFMFTLGERRIAGPVHGSGGLISASADAATERMSRMIRQAKAGRPTGAYEPRQGHVICHVHGHETEVDLAQVDSFEVI